MTPADRDGPGAGLVEDLKRPGFVADALARSGQSPALVAPPA